MIPLGLNEMTVPRLSIIASFGTILMLLVAGIWIALAANTFLSQFEDAFAAVNEESGLLPRACQAIFQKIAVRNERKSIMSITSPTSH